MERVSEKSPLTGAPSRSSPVMDVDGLCALYPFLTGQELRLVHRMLNGPVMRDIPKVWMGDPRGYDEVSGYFSGDIGGMVRVGIGKDETGPSRLILQDHIRIAGALENTGLFRYRMVLNVEYVPLAGEILIRFKTVEMGSGE